MALVRCLIRGFGDSLRSSCEALRVFRFNVGIRWQEWRLRRQLRAWEQYIEPR